MFDHNEQQCVSRREGEAFNFKSTIHTVEHAAGSVVLWGCFTASGSAALKKVHGIMKKEDYLQNLQENLKSSAEDWQKNYCMYIFDPADLVTFSEDL